MSREIKFRAFGGATNDRPAHMVYGIEDESGYGGECFGDFLGENSGWTVMQFTGLKDKNGKEVYEGDVVKWISIPVFGDAEVFIKPVEWVGQMLFPTDLKTKEVIGNIYENPELLK